MRIYLVRHGKAADEGYPIDEHRPLTDDGRALMRRTAKAWSKQKGPAPELWIVSPLVRAVQTCEICVDAFSSDGPVIVSADLEPEARVSNAADLFSRGGYEAIAVVSHEPLMSELASHLLGMRYDGFKTGMVVAMERKAPGEAAKLRWILDPAKEDRDPKVREEP